MGAWQKAAAIVFKICRVPRRRAPKEVGAEPALVEYYESVLRAAKEIAENLGVADYAQGIIKKADVIVEKLKEVFNTPAWKDLEEIVGAGLSHIVLRMVCIGTIMKLVRELYSNRDARLVEFLKELATRANEVAKEKFGPVISEKELENALKVVAEHLGTAAPTVEVTA